jgi:hypothetical protein
VFSEQDKRQLRGRIWRHPQTRQCIIYDFVALQTGDVILNNIARLKKDMVEAFTCSTEYGRRE